MRKNELINDSAQSTVLIGPFTNLRTINDNL